MKLLAAEVAHVLNRPDHGRSRARRRRRLVADGLVGAVGGRASGALISIDKAWLRAAFRGGSFVDGCGTVAQTALRRCLRLSCGEWLAARCDGEKLVSSHTKGLCSGET